jgi:hypothetical protein
MLPKKITHHPQTHSFKFMCVLKYITEGRCARAHIVLTLKHLFIHTYVLPTYHEKHHGMSDLVHATKPLHGP